jgi:hypothetical protein
MKKHVLFRVYTLDLLKKGVYFLRIGEENQKIMNIVNKHNSENAGDGTQVYMHSLKEMLEDLMKLPNYPFIKA